MRHRLIACFFVFAGLALVVTSTSAAPRPERKDGQTKLYCGNTTKAEIYQPDNKTLREVEIHFRDRRESTVYRDDGKTIHYSYVYDNLSKRKTSKYFGPDGKLRIQRTLFLDIEGEIGTGVKVSERMRCAFYNKDGDEEYVQDYTFQSTGKDKSSWVLTRVMEDRPGPKIHRTWLEFRTDGKGNEEIWVYRMRPDINGASGRMYTRKTLPAEYKDWLNNKYGDDDFTAPDA